ncbi:MAG: hypothetical protein HKN22_01590 [Bacteroidia bacterium]|nr:hypothetical protein [Bacteroidia bacterium]
MALLKFLFFFIIAVFLFRIIARPLMRLLFGQLEKKMRSEMNNNEPVREEGEVRIEDASSGDQEFSDYEEIK